jgi:hypothetical protein
MFPLRVAVLASIAATMTFVVAAPPVLAQPKKKPADGAIDLIALLDLKKDVVTGKWRLEKGELRCEEGGGVPRVQIPYIPPREYDFLVTFRQPKLHNGISLIMPNPNGGSFFWFLGNGDGTAYGFFRNPYKQGIHPDLLQTDKLHTTVVEVREATVRGLVDGKEMMKLETDFSDLSADRWRKIDDVRLLAVACDDPTVFTSVRVVEVTGKGKKIR